MCAQFGTIVGANNYLARGGQGLTDHPIQLHQNFNFVNIILCLQKMTNKDNNIGYYIYQYHPPISMALI